MKSLSQKIEPLEYALASAPPFPQWLEAEIPAPVVEAVVPVVDPAELERRWEEEKQKAFDAGRVQGREEAFDAGRREGERNLRLELAAAAAKLAAESDRYLHAVESEVAKLALGIAARVLRREAELDPLLLIGSVRVALGQVAAGTRVRLRVPDEQEELWKEAIALLPNKSVQLEVIADEAMTEGDCVIETEVGSADLGVCSQLTEIERNFFAGEEAHERATELQ